MNRSPGYRLDGRDVSREAFYATSCDPRRHVVVEACAGAGKTWMLVARIVRALVDGAKAQDILAITFTRKAAGEMRTRLSEWLREASHLDPDAAAARLIDFGVPASQAREQAAALIGLHERVLASGRAVEVRTFHAWYTQLLRAAPLDLLASLGLAPGMTPLEDLSDLKPALMQAFHAAVMASDTLASDYRLLTLRHGRYLLDAWFASALARRAEVELADAAGVLEASVEPASDANPASRVRDPALVGAARSLARQLAIRDKHKTQAEAAALGLTESLALADDRDAFAGLRRALFTDGGTPRKQLGELPEQAMLCEALDAIALQLAQTGAQQDHAAMVRLTRALFAEYAVLKRRRGLIDMVDLERVALAMLSDHALSGWVQQRLDSRVRHLLIDEFQDTSPLQWHALHGWLAAYAGAGGGEAPRLFIVGDPKQSIYRFRRAEPRVFEAAQHFVVQALGGTLATCDHTRRCAPGVVRVINAVFAAAAQEGSLPHWRAHTTERPAVGDLAHALTSLAAVERPPRLPREAGDVDRVWRPSLTEPRIEAKAVLREAEGGAVALAIERLVRGEGVAPRDIMVLARKRAVLAQAADALAALRLPYVVPEDLRLADSPEVQDLLAVLDVLASPGQSLSLARALKSPLFDASDEELLLLARRVRSGEAGGWWPALMACQHDASAPAALQRAAALLAQWQAAARTLPPHDLLDRIVHQGDLLPRLAAVVPPERHAQAMEAVRALLVAALELDAARYSSPYSFVRALRQRRVLAPPAQRHDAVRLLTIHGAKGLEARVVFLMDTEPEPARPETAGLLIDWPVEATRPRRVAFVAAEARCPPSLEPLLAEERAARSREEFNALYVALTRAEQRLIVSRTVPRGNTGRGSWWSRLEGLAQPCPGGAMPHSAARATHGEYVAMPLDRGYPAIAEPAATDDGSVRLGQAVHRVLQWAAGTAGSNQRVAELAGAAASEFGIVDAAAVESLASRMLRSRECAPFFDDKALSWVGNEVPIAGVGALAGAALRVDRLIRTKDVPAVWWVLDYKLDRAPQLNASDLAQLAAYRAAVQALQSGERVRAAFITATGALIEPE